MGTVASRCLLFGVRVHLPTSEQRSTGGERRFQRVSAKLRPREIAVCPELFATTVRMNCPDDLAAAGLLPPR
ncbi:MAG: hypothetical protein N2644_06095 [Candidatus Sumerlaea chitinivorans]|nr:hypothetical protein [Candidatus Sumerlaea chitinivorans]